MLALNSGMFELYGDAAKIFQSNILGSAVGSSCMGGQASLNAPSVPIDYQPEAFLRSRRHPRCYRTTDGSTGCGSASCAVANAGVGSAF